MTLLQRATRAQALAFGAAIVLGLGLGAVIAAYWFETPTQKLVMPKPAGLASVEDVGRKISVPQLTSAVAAFQASSPWGQLADGRQQPKAPGAQPALVVQRWLLVGRVNSPGGVSVVLHQPETGVSKRFHANEVLPDGRTLLSIEDAALVVRAAKGKKNERLEIGSGLVIQSTPATTATGSVSP
jgi:hypothetical protein